MILWNYSLFLCKKQDKKVKNLEKLLNKWLHNALWCGILNKGHKESIKKLLVRIF